MCELPIDVIDIYIMARNYKPDPKIKPLYASFLDMEIGHYLISKEFEIFLKRYNLDERGEYCNEIRKLRDRSGVGILVPGYTGYAEETFEIFLNFLYNKLKKEKFIELIKLIMIEFLKWRENNGYLKISNEELAKLKESLEYLIIEDANDEEIEEYKIMINNAFNEIKKYNKVNYIKVISYKLNSTIKALINKEVELWIFKGPIWLLLILIIVVILMIINNVELFKTLIEILKK